MKNKKNTKREKVMDRTQTKCSAGKNSAGASSQTSKNISGNSAGQLGPRKSTASTGLTAGTKMVSLPLWTAESTCRRPGKN